MVNVYPVQSDILQKVVIVDERATKAYDEDGVDAAVSYVTSFSWTAGNTVHRLWMDFYSELFVASKAFTQLFQRKAIYSVGVKQQSLD
jgi:hypothetical protein